MNNTIEIVMKILNSKIFYSIVIVVVSFLIFRGFNHLIKKARHTNTNNRAFKNKTIIGITLSSLRYIMMIVVVLMLLQVNGVNVSSMLAGVGIISAIVGLSIQDALKDIIRGFTIVSDEYFKVGDIIKYKEITGKVSMIGIRSTKMYDIKTGNEITIANRNIEQVEKISKELYVRINFPYEIKIKKADKVANLIADLLNKEELIYTAKNVGLVELAGSSKDYCIAITCHPEDKLKANRIALRTIADVMEENNIDIPYQQIDIHNK